VPLRVVLDMLRAIQFDDQAVREANEIDNVRSDGGLPTEFDVEPAGSQECPRRVSAGVASLRS
jgi:hypothetical protein